jgi:hypothetical protein
MQQNTHFDPNDHLITVTGGADYLEVKWRLVWFRNDHPEGQIFTEVQEHDRHEGYARVKARVQYDRTMEDGTVKTAIAESTGTEIISDFPDYLEKAETKAIGRALAALGYGTQFATDFDMQNEDGSQHVVDAPVAHSERDTHIDGVEDEAYEEALATRQKEPVQLAHIECEECGSPLTSTPPKGNRKGMSVQEKADFSIRRTGRVLCYDCYQDEAFKKSAS